MSFISWNCQGLGNPCAVPTLKDLIRTYHPDVIFLCETKVHARRLEDIRVALNFDSSFAVDSSGRSGGLALLWKQPYSCHLINYFPHFINVSVTHPKKPTWRLTGFYGYPERNRRKDSWDLLRYLAQDNSLPWCVIGDFNDILSNQDKRGLIEHPTWLLRGFREAVMDSELVAIPLEGYNFTWTKSRGSPTQVEERLDRAMATQSWLNQFPDSRLINAVAARSDHSPILLKLSMQTTLRTRQSFRFENAWLDEPGLSPLVEASWHRGHFPDILDRLKSCSKDMDEWGRQLRLRFRAPIDACRRQLLELREKHDANFVSAFLEAQERLSTLLAREETFWKQRAKVYWLKNGDKNTKFFHAMASERKKKNLIQRLTKLDGTIVIAQ
ncbi:uncharacterized protein LOC109791576 [Cajanus cajan]|uniref:uncharacterized protein LOC109791576 n=1 Tax=Cajanus cajan TaxID=3821 RepID=UPI00098D7784|nr:uncharacterized protein LOC109791576 [Cajanus cajan]